MFGRVKEESLESFQKSDVTSMKIDETILGRIGKGVDVVRWKINKIGDGRDAMVCKRRRNGVIILQYQNFMKNMLKSLTLICSGENH